MLQDIYCLFSFLHRLTSFIKINWLEFSSIATILAAIGTFFAAIASLKSANQAKKIADITKLQFDEQRMSLRPIFSFEKFTIVTNQVMRRMPDKTLMPEDSIEIHPRLRFKNSGNHPLQKLVMYYGYACADDFSNFKVYKDSDDFNILTPNLDMDIDFFKEPAIIIDGKINEDAPGKYSVSVGKFEYLLYFKCRYQDLNTKKTYEQEHWASITSKYMQVKFPIDYSKFVNEGIIFSTKKSFVEFVHNYLQNNIPIEVSE